jgi:hypothetical protein
MTEQEKDRYLGNWHSYDFLFRELEVGDLVMFETHDGVEIAEIHRIDEDGDLWHYNRWIIPTEQIIAVKED